MKVVTFGELMVRLQPFNYERFVQANSLEFTFGGGEANVAVSLANYGMDVGFLTVLPDNPITDACVRELRGFGVDTSRIVTGDGRFGVYYVEGGANQLPSRVIYDRAWSAIAMAKPGDIDWDKAFAGVEWFHITGITPAISESAMELSLESVKEAKKRNITVSCDLNYRKKLWSREQAGEVMAKLLPYVDVCIANEEDAKDVFGIEAENTDINSGKLDHAGYISVARQIAQRFGCRKVAITLRGSLSASDNDWAGMLYDAASDKAVFSPTYRIHIVDRVGGGDSFGGGLIYALMSGKDDQAAINFAVAASCLKHSIEHDFNQMSVAEVEALAAGNASGRVQR